MRILLLFPIFFLLISCALNRHQTPGEKEFGVPAELADKFVVKEEAPAAIPVAAPAAPAPESAKADGKKKKKGKAAVQKEAKKKEPDFPNRWGVEPFFRTGERYVFDITYFGATAGNLDLELLPPKVVADRPVYHIKAWARTSSVFSLFYTLNDSAESFLDQQSLFSHKFSLKLDESLQQREVLELYDQKAHKAYYWSKLDHKKKGKSMDQFEIPIAPFTQDGLSAFFYVRTHPLKVGDTFQFSMVTNGKLRVVQVTVDRKEEIKTRIGTRPAIVLKPQVVLDGVLKTSGGDSYVWISDDPERIILKVDAKIKIGSVIAYLREHSYGKDSDNGGK